MGKKELEIIHLLLGSPGDIQGQGRSVQRYMELSIHGQSICSSPQASILTWESVKIASML